MTDSSDQWGVHGTEAIALGCHNIDLEVRPEENSWVVVGIDYDKG